MMTIARLSFILVVYGFCSWSECYDVRLSTVQGKGQGLVEVRRSNGTEWGKICDNDFGENEARVVCRQLGFRYARPESHKAQRPSAAFVLNNLRCQGDEANIGTCYKQESGYSSCSVSDVHANVYAGVCCSHSVTFGDQVGDVFISHCAVPWLKGEETCETFGGHLSNPGQEFARRDALKGMSAPGLELWIGTFFTPWIWSNGCVRLQDPAAILRLITIATNSPKLCVQHCGLLSNAFLLAGTQCACVKPDAVVSEVRPYLCSALCPGDDKKWYCGSQDQQYWNIFTTASDDIFYSYSGPGADALTQCAVLTTKKIGPSQLTSHRCEENKGHICQQFTDSKSDLDLLYMQSAGDMGSVEMARKQCGKKSGDLKLVGNSVLDKKRSFYGDYFGLWVDLTRMRTDIDPELNKSSLAALNPKWCFSMTGNGSTALVSCDNPHLFSCVIDTTKSPDGGSRESTTTGTTEDVSRQEMIHLVIILCAALLVALIIIGIVICWVRRTKRKSLRLCCCGNPSSASRPDPSTGYSAASYQATATGNTDAETVYDEINDGKMENLYHEIGRGSGNSEYQALNTNDDAPAEVEFLKAPVSMQRSYSHPHDMMLVGKNNSDSIREKNYTYPYDSLLRAKCDVDTCENDVTRDTANGVAVKCNAYVTDSAAFKIKDNTVDGNQVDVDLLGPVECVNNVTYAGNGLSDNMTNVRVDNQIRRFDDHEVEIRLCRKSDSVLHCELKRASRETPMRNSAS
ncbi:hypothetical protein DPMN_058228 [Dreissena polymorpha]|uniref:SRCR domain-containing protein n=1 Tax=Dreissena polymorpha TaxID=45954 RepID=A0A9D4HDB8_DREPO|nr:hypothetical protein DPMN_058228 [Dreissena polymorpha]